jgi:preprotein translocase subunit SecY
MLSSIKTSWATPEQTTREQFTFRRRVVETLFLLLLFRAMALVPLLHVNEEKLHHLLAHNPLIGAVNLFAGGEVLEHFSLAAAGILPYLVALALVEWASWFVPSLRELRARGEHGKKRLELYGKMLTIPLAFLFAWLLSQYLAQQVGLFPGKIR